jgi:hypothetical protein
MEILMETRLNNVMVIISSNVSYNDWELDVATNLNLSINICRNNHHRILPLEKKNRIK